MKFFVTLIQVSIFSSTLSLHTQKPKSLLKKVIYELVKPKKSINM